MDRTSASTNSDSFTREDADFLCAQLRDLSRVHRALRKCWARLLYDLLAIASKVRSAVLLDYIGGMTRDTLERIVDQINMKQQRWCVMFHQDAWFVLNPSELCKNLVADMDKALVNVTTGGGCSLIRGKESKDFSGLQAQLLCFVESAFSEGACFADFSTPAGNLSMVTLTGLLLDYPVIYYIREDKLASARDTLSNCILELVNIELDSSIAQSQCQLLCFSVPKVATSTEPIANNLIQSFVSKLKSSASKQQALWGDLRMTISQAPGRSIAL